MGSSLYAELTKLLRSRLLPNVPRQRQPESPVSGISFAVAYSVKSRHTANEILKQAGLLKAF